MATPNLRPQPRRSVRWSGRLSRPACLPMLIYAFAASNGSVAALFLAGIVLGVLLGLSMLVVTATLVRRKNYPITTQCYNLRDLV